MLSIVTCRLQIPPVSAAVLARNEAPQIGQMVLGSSGQLWSMGEIWHAGAGEGRTCSFYDFSGVMRLGK